MRKVQCGECRKSYDYDEDGFCPHCGAFNQPGKSTRVGADGSVIRMDGLNEANHHGSFVHRELHQEERARKLAGLDKGVQRIQRPQARPAQTRRPSAYTRSERSGKKNPFKLVLVLIGTLIALQFLSTIVWRLL